MTNKPSVWLDDDQYEKAVGQLRLGVANVLSVFNMYGMGIMVEQAIVEVVKLSEDFGLRVRGIDKPIGLSYIRRKK